MRSLRRRQQKSVPGLHPLDHLREMIKVIARGEGHTWHHRKSHRRAHRRGAFKIAAKLSVPFHPEHALDWASPWLLIDKMRDLPGVARIRQHGSARLRPAFLAPDTRSTSASMRSSSRRHNGVSRRIPSRLHRPQRTRTLQPLSEDIGNRSASPEENKESCPLLSAQGALRGALDITCQAAPSTARDRDLLPRLEEAQPRHAWRDQARPINRYATRAWDRFHGPPHARDRLAWRHFRRHNRRGKINAGIEAPNRHGGHLQPVSVENKNRTKRFSVPESSPRLRLPGPAHKVRRERGRDGSGFGNE